MRRQGVRGASEELVGVARRLRREETPAEQVLWRALRDRGRDGIKFRRQHAVGPFVLDFFCPAHKLVIEVDGGIHDEPEQVERDTERTQQLQAVGYTILRFTNDQVLTDLRSVIVIILRHCNQPSS